MSKSGVHKHSDAKETLQISTVDKAFADFWHRVAEPAPAEPPGPRRATTPWTTWKRPCCPAAV
ncbi:hypothetical protein [Amycolatopsis sp. NPDC004079]|uniref:hypothetical protein n=1 Tax=Amycolatopsis sp. NPDC004079 TaxID=3154549 RepID=UPI0033B55182